VIQVTQKYARCTIHAFDGAATSSPLKGMIRREDVRQTEKDRVELSKCFRPSDIVLATIISLGDQSNYLLSTAGDSLGVILATNKYGYRLEPISWNEMRCPKTGVKESRKTARIQESLIEKEK
jgi:exosome complex component CSL4